MDEANGYEEDDIFSDVFFTIIASEDVPDAKWAQIGKNLLDFGATAIPLSTSGRLSEDKGQITHIIATNVDFPDFLEARSHMIAIVRPDWVKDSIMKGKIANPRQYSPDPEMIFSNIVVTCVGLPHGDIEAIRGVMLAAGGGYSVKPTKLVTHIVALDTANDEVQFAVSKGFRCKIVLPHWFDDCLKLRRQISETPYLLPNPAILRTDPEQDGFSPGDIELSDAHLDGALTPLPSSQPIPRNDINVFKGRSIMFSDDLDLSDHLLQTLKQIVDSAGGRAVNTVADADTVICRYRESSDFSKAYTDRKVIGNLAWFHYLITYNKWSTPTQRLLHFPIPRDGIPGFENTQISITIYTGDQRTYLQNLVHAARGTFTRTLKEDNTHLIAAHLNSEKCEAALEWNQVNVVNHMWLEESYASGIMRPTSNPRYTHFPARTHLGEGIGQTPIDTTELDRTYRKVSPPAIKNVTESSDKAEPKPRVGSTKLKTPAKRLNPQTPAPLRSSTSRLNETPGTSSSRGAKDRAISSLRLAAKDIEQFQKELKRVGGVTHGGPRPKDEAPQRSKKRPSTEPAEEDDEDEQETDDGRKSKRSKIAGKLPAITHRLMVSKYQKWTDRPDSEAKDRNKLRNLGVHITNNPVECTILCAPRIVKTMKFVAALAAAPIVVNTEWIDACLKSNSLPANNDEYLLSDKREERSLDLNLSQSLRRAEMNQRKLLRGWQIFCTEDISGGYETIATIVRANGGLCSLYTGRSVMNAAKRKPSRETQEDRNIADNQGEDEGNTLYLLSTEKSRNQTLWAKFRKMAQSEDMVPKIVTSDWLLQVAMSQQVHPAVKWQIKTG